MRRAEKVEAAMNKKNMDSPNKDVKRARAAFLIRALRKADINVADYIAKRHGFRGANHALAALENESSLIVPTGGLDAFITEEEDFWTPDDPPAQEAGKSKSQLKTTAASLLKVRNIDFIWPLRLARGKHTMIAGIGGLGKSQLVYWIVSTISTGGKWPDGGKAPKGSCIILSAEDGPEDVMVPRLIAAGADLDKIHIVRATVDEKGHEAKFNLQLDLFKLRTLCRELGDVVLIAFDPVSSYLGGDLDSHRNADVRRVLDPLNQLAEDVQCAVLSVSHFNKGTAAQAINRVMESAAFVNAPRASFGVFNDPDKIGALMDVDSKLFLPLKTNIGEVAKGWRFHIEGATGGVDYRDNKPICTSRVIWDGVAEITADEVVKAENERGSPRLNDAVRFLQQELGDEDKLIADVKEHADAEMITPSTLRRARERLGVKAIKTKAGAGGWVYQLPKSKEGMEALKKEMSKRKELDPE
jgi:AAA domain-containing protein